MPERLDAVPEGVAGLSTAAAQEGLRNVTNHAEATSARRAVGDRGSVRRARGHRRRRGFDDDLLSARVEAGHVGLKALRGLLTDAGGSLEVRSVPGEGTTFRVRVPLP